MNIFFYRTFNSIGEAVILIRKSDFDFSDLPDSIKIQFENVEAQEDEFDISNLSSRWWLSPKVIDALKAKSYDCFRFVRG
ncbi:hypothetical protein [Shewanella oncorhynchi]|uniref:hypothetical protein n=1 Tax=Shewanella oncorhynchi TaxID=2726434 RepID=UPI002E7AB0D1|nr:hypothetical protein [Shewanella oncorhynchi]WVI92728.1 hypothetical protein VR487_18175 [Shewanella oncorhynchi]